MIYDLAMYIIFILYKKTDQSYNNKVTSESRKVFSYFNISRLLIALVFDFTYGILKSLESNLFKQRIKYI